MVSELEHYSTLEKVLLTSIHCKSSTASYKQFMHDLSSKVPVFSCDNKQVTSSSSQWWSRHSTTPHNMLNLWLLMLIYDPSVWGTRRSGWANSVASPWVPISSPLTHMVHLLPFVGYLAGSNSVSARPFDPDTMTYAALEATPLHRAAKNTTCQACGHQGDKQLQAEYASRWESPLCLHWRCLK